MSGGRRRFAMRPPSLAALASSLLARRNEARHAVRIMAAVLAAELVTSAFDLPQGYWAVFTTLIVMQGSVGGTLGASVDRMYGTILGAAIGAFAAWIRPQNFAGLVAALVVAGGVTAFISAWRPRLRVAPVTAAIMLLTSAGKLGPLHAALYRVIEIALGGVIGVAASLLIFPARSQAVATQRIRATIALLSELLGHLADRLGGGEATNLHPLHDRIRASLAAVETAMTDAARERASRLGQHRVSAALPRTLWRVRSDAITIGRALATPWPPELATQLGRPARAMLEADIAFLRACAEALGEDRAVHRGGYADASVAFEAAVESFRGRRLTHDLTFEVVGAVFGMAFALEDLSKHLQDLADRIDESARSDAPAGAPSDA